MVNSIYKLSIIIPMYNAEKYIEDCLNSILNSDLPEDEYEVIVINDGSIDNGSEIAQAYASRFPQFLYLTQENQGQSVARNYGIREAKGEYIWCVDADDKLESSLLPLYRLIEKLSGTDIIAFQLKQITEEGKIIGYECGQPSVTHNVIMKGRDAVLSGYMPSSVCALVIRKQHIMEHNLYFKIGITQQDVELSYRLFAYADSVYFSELRPYLYIHHKNSTSKALNPRKLIKYECDKVVIIKSFRGLSASLENRDKELSNYIWEYADSAIFGCVYNLWKNRKQWRPLGVNKAVIAKLKEEHFYPLKGPFGSWKKRLVSFFLNIEILIS